jgi:hypothetical protein
MGPRTRIRIAACLLILGAMAGLVGSLAGPRSGAVVGAAEGAVAEAALIGAGAGSNAGCVVCGATLVVTASTPLGLMMLGPGGARLGAACALQCALALHWN